MEEAVDEEEGVEDDSLGEVLLAGEAQPEEMRP